MKIVIVGGSYAGHKAFSTIYEKFLSADVDVTLVSKTTKSYYNVAGPRLLAESDKLPQTFFLIEKFVASHSGNKAKFMHAEAVETDFQKNTIVVQTADGLITLDYDILVLASGSKSQFDGFKVNDSAENVEQSIRLTVEKLQTAKLVAVIGGGPTGVETAAEIASSCPNAKVTIYTGSKGPLLAYPKLVSKAATKLSNKGVTVIDGVRSTNIERKEDSTRVTFDNGETMSFDLVVESTKDTPYSQYIPDSVKDDAGYVIADKHLIAKGTKNVVVFGDILAGSGKTLVDIKLSQHGVFVETMRYLLGKSALPSKEYEPCTDTILVPISHDGGVGMIFGFQAPNFVVRLLKSKTYMIDKAGEWFE